MTRTDLGGRGEGGGPVDRATATDAGAGQHDDVAVGRRVQPAALEGNGHRLVLVPLAAARGEIR